MKNIFDQQVVAQFIGRIEQLSIESRPLWGKMAVGQMLAHLNVSYEMIYEEKHAKPNGFVRLMLKLFVKNTVVNTKPYKKNSMTAPQFVMKDDKDFEVEKQRLIDFINKTMLLGPTYFDNKASHSFGKLKVNEWNNMLYKHLDHHLAQFGV